MATVLEVRQALVDRGFTPIPVIGKAPPFKSWQNISNVSRQMLEAWARNWPRATNTGILTRVTPTIDIDILNELAAIAAEGLARERFEERGHFLRRVGQPPKFVIPFRTLQPFGKLTTNFIVPAGADSEKIEFLCNGQQFVAHGIHPGTKKPYGWFGGDPTTIAYDASPTSLLKRPSSSSATLPRCWSAILVMSTAAGARRVRAMALCQVHRRIGRF
jgi:hypothetical protein